MYTENLKMPLPRVRWMISKLSFQFEIAVCEELLHAVCNEYRLDLDTNSYVFFDTRSIINYSTGLEF